MGWDEKVDKFGVKLSPEFIIKYLRWKFLYSDIMVWRVDDTEGTNICIILGLVAKNVEFVTGLMKKFGYQLSCNEEYPEIEAQGDFSVDAPCTRLTKYRETAEHEEGKVTDPMHLSTQSLNL